MNIMHTLSSAVTAAPAATNAAGSNAGATPGNSGDGMAGINNLATQGTFITLLVAQLENQDPLNPTDATTFVTQLAQFTQVDQMVGIAQNVAAIAKDLGNSAGASSATQK